MLKNAKAVRINIGEGEKTYRELEDRLVGFLRKIKTRFEIKRPLIMEALEKGYWLEVWTNRLTVYRPSSLSAL